jgi:putative nucleotidyltransferase with HDIG domain
VQVGTLRMRVYAGALVAVAGSSIVLLVAAGYGIEDIWTTVALCIVAALAERGTVRLGKTTEQSISLLPTLFAAVMFGPLPAAMVGAASMLGDPELRHRDPARRPYLKLAVYSSSRCVAGAAAGLAAEAARHFVPSGFGAVALASVCAAIIAEALDVAIAALTAHVRRTRSVREVLSTHIPLVLTSAPLYAPVVAILTLAYTISPWTTPLFFGPALAAQRLFGLYQEQRRLADDLGIANETLARANLSFAAALVATLDARDRYTAGHSAAVAIYSRDIAARMGMPTESQELVYLCGLVHDIGKIGLPAGLLEKPGALTLEERRQMQEHSAIGERILANVEDYGEIAKIVRHHHERMDGEGYPDRLQGETIPKLSRVIAVADAYNAMTSDRPYRDAMPSRVARLRLAQAVESQFDTDVVAAFEAVLASADEPYRLAQRADFALVRGSYEPSTNTDAEPVAGAA